MKIRTGRSFVSMVLVLAIASVSFSGHAQSVSQSQGMACHVPDMSDKSKEHDHHAMMTHTMATMAQDQDRPPGQGDQPEDTPTHRKSPGDGCSAVNPNAPNKDRNGVNPNTVGCKCAKKCANGQTQEDLSKDEKGVYVCKNACYKNRCSCPDPCKS